MSILPRYCADALKRDPSLPALEYEGKWVDWGWMRQIADTIVTMLGDSGIAADAPVAFVAGNRPTAAATYLALLSQGRTIRMLYPFQSSAAIAAALSGMSVAALIGDEKIFGAEVLAALDAKGLPAIRLSPFEVEAIPGHEKAKGAALDVSIPAEPRIEILTSGTTGAPKPFPLPFAVAEEFLVAASPYAKGISADAPPTLLYMPIANISGAYTFLPVLIHGQPGVLLERFSLEAWLDYMRRYRPASSGIPASFVQQLIDMDVPRADLASLKYMGMGAAPLAADVQRAFEDKYDIPILVSYGATEFVGPVTSVTPEHIAAFGRSKTGSVGRPMMGARVRIVDPETGRERATGEEGVVEVVSPRRGGDWIRTSDLGYLDGDGFLYIVGRADGAIMRGGFKVLPSTIETALLKHDAVAEAVVTAVPDARLGQVPGAVIRPAKDMDAPTPEALKTHLREHVLATHIPVHWRFVDALPRTGSAKIDLAAIARLFEP